MIDVSLRISILKLMTELNKKFNVSFIYITHDLSTARYIAQNGKICVMYLGEIMEMGKVEDLLSNPRHPYTKALIKAVPVPDPKKNNTEDLPLKSMDLANIEDRTEGCSFYARCLYATDKCKNKVPYVEKNGVIVKCCNLEACNEH
jgi:peptide/nickel transport system ATP-binding protein